MLSCFLLLSFLAAAGSFCCVLLAAASASASAAGAVGFQHTTDTTDTTGRAPWLATPVQTTTTQHNGRQASAAAGWYREKQPALQTEKAHDMQSQTRRPTRDGQWRRRASWLRRAASCCRAWSGGRRGPGRRRRGGEKPSFGPDGALQHDAAGPSIPHAPPISPYIRGWSPDVPTHKLSTLSRYIIHTHATQDLSICGSRGHRGDCIRARCLRRRVSRDGTGSAGLQGRLRRGPAPRGRVRSTR